MHCASGRMGTQSNGTPCSSSPLVPRYGHALAERRDADESRRDDQIILANMPVQLQEYTDKYRK